MTKEVDNPLLGYWANSGLELGDTVLIHSSMKRTFRVFQNRGFNVTPKILIDSLINQVGSSGTVIFPTFNFDFPNSKFFSKNETKSQMGVLTEFVRENYEGYRTGHPMYSFYAIGYLAAEFKEINNYSAYGIDSPFAKLIQLDGKIASIDLDDQDCMTIYHHVEELAQVPYRYPKIFTGQYQDENKEITIRDYMVFVRNLDMGVKTNVNPMGEILWKEGCYVGNRKGSGNGLRTIKSKLLFSRTYREISEGRAFGTLYVI